MKFALLAITTHPSAQPVGLFDVKRRAPWLVAKGNPLSRLDAVLDWENFRVRLAQALAKPAKELGGRPANGPSKMFKLLIVQR